MQHTITYKRFSSTPAGFGAICMPAAEELGLLLKDKIAAYRSRNLEAIAQKTEAKLEGQKPSPSGEANPLLVREVIEDASWTIFLDGISTAALA